MRVLLLGGSGTLGKELLKIIPDIYCPSHKEIDITNQLHVENIISDVEPDIVIHAAAITNNRDIEKNPVDAIATNIIGTAIIAANCYDKSIRMVYISTDYLYKGDKGNYSESDPLLPFNLYSWTKLGGECSVKAVKNHLIIRTSFGKDFQYSQAFTDKWTSKDYVDRIAPMIYEAAISPITGVLNIGTERKTLYTHASERSDTVKPIKIDGSNYHTPYDTSLNIQKWLNFKSGYIAKPHIKCRVCGNENLTKYLDLGLMPLANNLEFTAQRAKQAERYPLQLMFCENCSLSQLSVVIDPQRMFSYYTYRSSVNKGYVEHCENMAKDLEIKLNLTSDSFMIDIAGNDGTLLKEFKKQIGLKALNIDPATNIVAIAEAEGVESIADFWSVELAEKIKQSHGQADLITATNVFAHVDNIKDFVMAAKILLKPNGVLVLEFPYLKDFIEEMEYDTIYFEHLSYFNISPLKWLCKWIDVDISHVTHFDIHGGSIRVEMVNGVYKKERFENINLEEQGYDTIDKYKQWAASVNDSISNFSEKILEIKKQGFKISAFGASAKGNTLLNATGMNTDIIDEIYDETPEKLGKFSPGTGIPIVNKQNIIKNNPDYIVILSWNFKEQIIEKCRLIGYKGKFIIPIPNFKILQLPYNPPFDDSDCFDDISNFNYEKTFTAPIDGKYIINGKEFDLKAGDIIRKEDLDLKP